MATRVVAFFSKIFEMLKYLENLVQQIEKSCVVINNGSHSELAIRLQKK